MFLLVLCSYDFNAFFVYTCSGFILVLVHLVKVLIICIPFIFLMYIIILDHDYDVDTSKVLGVTLSSSFY